MKKNNIFRYEINDSVQVKATLNCLTNRNKKYIKESIGEVYPDSRWGEKERLNGPNGMSKTERDVLIKLEQIMPNLVQKAMSKAADHDNPDEIKKLVLSMIMQGNLMKKLSDKVGASWKEFSMGFKSEIINLVKNEFDKHEEQEESSVNYSQLADDVCASYRGRLSKLDLKDSIKFIVQMMLKKLDKNVSPQEMQEIQKAAKHSVWYVSEQEETTTPPWIGRQYNGGIDFDADGNLQIITPDDDDDDDDFEAPPLFDSEQERHDIALECSYCLGESFIENDGDLDDIYYAVLKIFDSTHDAPASTNYDDILNWCRKYYKEIELLIMEDRTTV